MCPRTPIAEICSVEPPVNNVDVVQVSNEEVHIEEISGGPEQVQLIQQTVHDLMAKMDIADGLQAGELKKARDMIGRCIPAFCKDAADTGGCDEVHHRIPMTSNETFKIAHKKIPPNQWDEVRVYLKKSLEMGIICQQVHLVDDLRSAGLILWWCRMSPSPSSSEDLFCLTFVLLL